MSNRKSPLILQVLIVTVALFLGLSLNMFQFRNPFRFPGTDSQRSGEAARKPQSPPSPVPEERESSPVPAIVPYTKQEATPPGVADNTVGQPVSAPATQAPSAREPGSEERAGAGTCSPQAPNTTTSSSAPEKSSPSPLAEPSPSVPEKLDSGQPHDMAGQADISAGHEEDFTTWRESPTDSAPRVTSAPAMVRSAKIGREVPAASMTPDGNETSTSPDGSGSGTSGEPASKTSTTTGQQLKSGGSEDSGIQAGPTATQAPERKLQTREEREASEAATKAQAGPPDARSSSLPIRTREEREAVQAGSAQKTGEGPGSELPSLAEEEKAAGAKTGKVLDFKVQDLPGEFVLTIVTDSPVERVTSFHAKSPARLVVDLVGGWQAEGPPTRAVGSDLVEKIRVGVHPDKLRLVIDYKDKNLAVVSEPIIERQPRAVVIKLPKVEAGQ